MKRILDDLSVFCAVVEEGNLKRASARLAIPHSTVSRRIEALETNLGLRLLHRTTREIKVSKRGQALYEDCAGILQTVHSAIGNIVSDEIAFRGELKVSLPVRAGIDFLGGWLIDFAAQHPDLTLDLSLSNDNKNLLQEQIDLAFRVGPLPDSSAIALHLWDIPYVLCCTQSFLNHHRLTQCKLTTEQIEALPCVISRPARHWVFSDEQKQQVSLTPKPGLWVDDLGLARHAVLSGQFLGMLPRVMMQDTEALEVAVPLLRPRTRVMYAYFLGRRHSHSQIKRLTAYIRERYQASLEIPA